MMGVLNQWDRTVKPSHDEFVVPTKKYCDFVISGNTSNKTAVRFIADNLGLFCKTKVGGQAESDLTNQVYQDGSMIASEVDIDPTQKH